MPQIRHFRSFASIAARDAFVYPPYALNQWVRVTGSPPVTYQVTSVSAAGVATFAELGTSGFVSPVTSVFGRTGAVVAAGGDYTVAQVTGAVANTRAITAGTGLSGGGDLSADRTLTLGTTYRQVYVPRIISVALVLTAAQQVVIAGGSLELASGGSLDLGDDCCVEVEEVNPVFGVWVPSAKPAGLQAQSDYFDSGHVEVDPRWVIFDPGKALTAVQVDTARRMLKITATGDGTIRFAGLAQPLVDVEEVYFTSVGVDAKLTVSGASAELCLLENLTSTGKIFAISRIVTTTTNLVRARHMATYASAATADATQSSDAQYLSIRRNVGSGWFDFSLDGIEYQQLFTGTLGFTPSYVGLLVESGTTGEPVTGSFDYFYMKTATGASTRRTYLPGALI